MVKTILTTALLTTFISSALAAVQYTTPDVWECDSPGTEGYFISNNAVTYDGAADACVASGGYLADITNQNFLFSTDLVRKCIGDNQNAWIRSWDYNPTNPQERNCLAMYVGFTGPGGGIDLECSGSRYALCMVNGKRHLTPNNNVRNYGFISGGNTVTVTKILDMLYPTPSPFSQLPNSYIIYEPQSSVDVQTLEIVDGLPLVPFSESTTETTTEENTTIEPSSEETNLDYVEPEEITTTATTREPPTVFDFSFLAENSEATPSAKAGE